MIFVDAWALVAIVLREAEADAFADRIEASSAPVTSPIAIYEAVLAVTRASNASVSAAKGRVYAFLSSANIRTVEIGFAEASAALDAHDRFGKGRHPARLNMGDCFAYACACTHSVPLLFKGEDFARTDVVGRRVSERLLRGHVRLAMDNRLC